MALLRYPAGATKVIGPVPGEIAVTLAVPNVAAAAKSACFVNAGVAGATTTVPVTTNVSGVSAPE